MEAVWDRQRSQCKWSIPTVLLSSVQLHHPHYCRVYDTSSEMNEPYYKNPKPVKEVVMMGIIASLIVECVCCLSKHMIEFASASFA